MNIRENRRGNQNGQPRDTDCIGTPRDRMNNDRHCITQKNPLTSG
jgi:hypothetical protein